MFQYLGLDWLAMVLTFSAVYLLRNKTRYGFLVMMVGNGCWTIIGLWAHSYGMVLANLGFFAMNMRGYIKWAQTPASTPSQQSVSLGCS